MKNILEKITALSITTKWLLLALITIVLVSTLIILIFSGSGDITTNVELALKDIVYTSQLRTAEYTYNSIATVKIDDTVKCYVSYTGSVSAGINFENIKIERDEDSIRILVPDVEILATIVDPQMDYIFTNKNYDTETFYAEALKSCQEDLLDKAASNETLVKIAREGAKKTIMALLKPFESKLKESESFDIVFISNEKEADK